MNVLGVLADMVWGGDGGDSFPQQAFWAMSTVMCSQQEQRRQRAEQVIRQAEAQAPYVRPVFTKVPPLLPSSLSLLGSPCLDATASEMGWGLCMCVSLCVCCVGQNVSGVLHCAGQPAAQRRPHLALFQLFRSTDACSAQQTRSRPAYLAAASLTHRLHAARGTIARRLQAFPRRHGTWSH